MSELDRRSLLRAAAAGAGGLVLAGPLQAFAGRHASAAPRQPGHSPSLGGYGPLSAVADGTTGVPLLALPDGFQYWSFGEVGSVMSDGRPTPAAHDGMAAFKWRDKIRLVRNHEVRGAGTAWGPTALAYDAASGGGNTIIEFDPRQPASPRSWGALSGTSTNCAGGPTPWDSWLTCEETVEVQGQPHGYVFETPASADGFVAAEPLTSLGRFVHEAVAVNPRTNIIYLTEDAGLTSGLYRHVPSDARQPLAGGSLQMLKVTGVSNANLAGGFGAGTRFPVEWVSIDEPDPALPATPTVFQQGAAKGAANFSRLEGAYWSKADRAIYFNSTDGGAARSGQVWSLYTDNRGAEFVELVYESPNSTVLLKPDNIVVSPKGGVLLCEDPDRARQSFLRGLTEDGELYDFAANIRPGTIPGSTVPQSWDEFAGATFAGDWLFVNIQTPGITFAITGPWNRGPSADRSLRRF